MKELIAILVFFFVTDVIAAGLSSDPRDLTNQSFTFNNSVPDAALSNQWKVGGSSYFMTSSQENLIVRIQCSKAKFRRTNKTFRIQFFDKYTSQPMATTSLPMSFKDCRSIVKELTDGSHELNIHTESFDEKGKLILGIEVKSPKQIKNKVEDATFSGGFSEGIYRASTNPSRVVLTGSPRSPILAIAHCGEPVGRTHLHLEVRQKQIFTERAAYKVERDYSDCVQTLKKAVNGEVSLELFADGTISEIENFQYAVEHSEQISSRY